MLNISTITASEAREDLYNIIRKASMGLHSFEIKLRGVEPVILINKRDLDGWLETWDIMSNPEEVKAIKQARKETKTYTEDEVKKMLNL